MPHILQFATILLTMPLLFISPLSIASSKSIASSNITSVKQLIITGSSTWEPFSYINRDGKPDGIMVDYWKLYGEINNVDVRFHLLAWSESLDYAAITPNTIHGGLGYSSNRAKTLAYSRQLPLNHYNVNLFVHNTLSFDNLTELDEVLVGSVKGSIKHDFLKARIPEKNIKLFPTFGALNHAAYQGDIDMYIDDLNTALYDMRHTGNTGLFTPKRKLYSFPLHFAINKNSQNDIAAIEQGLDKIKSSDIDDIYKKWIPENRLHNILPWFDKRSQYFILFASIFILIISLVFYRRQLKHRTEELKLVIKELKESHIRFDSAAKNDTLTGVKTRHQFFTQLADKRFSPSPYVIAVLDINMLKFINESYGQDIGDLALKHLATQLRLQMSGRTLYSRLGGGEFGILFDFSDASQAMRKIHQLQKSLQLSPLYIDQLVIPVKISAGIACYPYDSEDGETLVRMATSRMRANKPNADSYKKSHEKDVSNSPLSKHWA